MSGFEELEVALRRNAAGMADCAAFCSLVSPNYLEDPLCILQLGLAVVMDKPIYLIVFDDVAVPDNLHRVARRIDRIPSDDRQALAAASRRMSEWIEELEP